MRTQLLVALFFLVVSAAGDACRGAEAPRPSRPNIVFILADDLGYGDLGCYGQQTLDTPRIDRMAAEGMRFTQHYAGSTVCAPSRACLLTGQHTGHVYQRANGQISFRLDPEDRCVASNLKEAGYATAMIGKSGLSCRTNNPNLANQKGFDHFFGYVSHGAAHRYFPEFLWRNGDRVDFPTNHGKSGEVYSGDLFLEDAMRWLEQEKSGPFFLHLSLQQPHLDLSAPPAWREKYLGKFEEQAIPEGGYRGESHPKATFAAMVAYLDDTVGRVIDKLHKLGVADNTLVLFSSDNGSVNEGGWSYKHFQSSGQFRGHKRDFYEGGVRVPLVAYWPGVIAPGKTSDHVSAFWDFAPTACELAGATPPAQTDGISYAPTLLGESEQPTHDYLYWEFYEQGGKQAVRRGDWKAIRLNVLQGDPKTELYNLSNDPAEENDLAATNPDLVAEMVKLMRSAHTPTDRHSMQGR